MKWLTLNEIKDQLRMERDFDDENDKLEMYGDSAEEMVLELCQRSYDDFMTKYGKIPTPVREASLLLVVAETVCKDGEVTITLVDKPEV